MDAAALGSHREVQGVDGAGGAELIVFGDAVDYDELPAGLERGCGSGDQIARLCRSGAMLESGQDCREVKRGEFAVG